MTKTSRRTVLKTLPIALLAGRPATAQMLGKYNVGPTKAVRNKAPNGVVALWPGPQLFVDDYLVLKHEGLAKTTHHPRRLPHPVLTSKEFGTSQAYMTVLRDAERGVFRAWYNTWVKEDGSKGGGSHLAYAESKDGVEWQAPSLAIMGKGNHLMAMNGYGAGVIDDGPGCADKARRFKLAWDDETKRPVGMAVAFSPDGLRWKAYEKNPVLSGYAKDDPFYTHTLGDTMEVFWDPLRARYCAFVKTFGIPEDGWLPCARPSNGTRRIVSASVSQDFMRWEMPWRVILPEPRDEGLLEFISASAVVCRGGLLIGCARMLHEDYSPDLGGPPNAVGYATLVTSRDGESWERHDDVFFNRNLNPEAWDHAMCWMGSQIVVGDETYFYYGGFKQGHKINPGTERQIGLAKLRIDGYVSRDAFGPEPGRLMTPLLRPHLLGALSVNAEASRGQVRVQVRDQRQQIVPGFSFPECTPLRDDGRRQEVKWSGNAALNKLEGVPFHLEFRVADARLYGFEFTRRQV